MKKLIAISVVFALAVGAAFAVDLGADVTAHAELFKGSSAGGGVTATGQMDAVKLKGSGEVMDGKFGAAMRADFGTASTIRVQGYRDAATTPPPVYVADGDPVEIKYSATTGEGYAYWKPIDQFKLIIGQSHVDDGFWGKEGVTGWMFNQKANDGIVPGGSKDNIWGGSYAGWPTRYRAAFADDYVAEGIFMEIKPMDMLGINIGLPVFGSHKWDKGFFKDIFFQVDLNFAFGNIAITYKGNNIFLYYGGSFGAIALDVGLSVPDLIDNPGFSNLFFGAGLKFSAGAFGVKFRTVVGIPVKSGANFDVIFGVLPNFAINDNLAVFVNAEMGMRINHGLQNLGFLFNPYLRIGAEWGPSFYAGIQVEKATKSGDVNFALPIGISVGF